MTEYIDDEDTPNNDNGVTGGPPEAGWPYAVKPAWIRELLDLWERDKLVTLLLELATDRVAQDIANPTTRRRTLLQIARYFVPHAGVGRLRRTVSPNVWAVHSQLFSAQVLAPAYLVQIAGSHNMARAVICLLHEAYAPGDSIELSTVRSHLFKRFGSRRTVRDSAGALLRTLEHFGVLARAGRLGDYRYASRLSVPLETFPLLVWAWLQAQPAGTETGVIDPAAFAADPLLTLIDADSYADHWDCYTDSLWTLEERDERQVAVLRHTGSAAFLRTLFNLLSSHPKWPAVKKQFPPHPD